VLTQPLQRRLDPFLMLDAFAATTPTITSPASRPPHRGFETVTYMIAGRMKHKDSAGHEGLLENGGVQWMTAGRGVIHSEIPQQEEGVMEGFQLWLNLPGRDKMSEPWYRDIKAAELPRFATDAGVDVTVIAGESHGIAGAVTREATAPLYLDLHLPAGSRFAQPLPAGHNAFVYVYRGEVDVAGTAVPSQRMAILANEADADGVVIEARGEAKALLIAGRPLASRSRSTALRHEHRAGDLPDAAGFPRGTPGLNGAQGMLHGTEPGAQELAAQFRDLAESCPTARSPSTTSGRRSGPSGRRCAIMCPRSAATTSAPAAAAENTRNAAARRTNSTDHHGRDAWRMAKTDPERRATY